MMIHAIKVMVFGYLCVGLVYFAASIWGFQRAGAPMEWRAFLLNGAVNVFGWPAFVGDSASVSVDIQIKTAEKIKAQMRRFKD